MLLELTVENFMRVTTAHLTFAPGLNVVAGKNRAGKSSIFAAIDALVGGAAAEPQDPVHHGAQKARVEGIYETADGKRIKIEKSWDEKRQRESFRVSSADGKESYKRPQELLEDLIGKGRIFEPRDFCRMKPAERDDVVRKMAGLDFADLDRRRQAIYEERTLVNRDGKAAAGAFASLPSVDKDTPDVEVDAADLSRKLAGAHQSNAARDRVKREQAHRLAEIERLTRELAAAKTAAAAEFVMPVEVDTAALEESLSKAQQTNANVRAKHARQQAAKRVDALRNRSEALSKQIDALDGDRRMMIENAEYPLPGMGFDADGGFTYQGVVFDQASEREQLELAVAIGLKLRPVILIRDGSDFDEDGLRELEAMVEKAGGQALIQIVKNADDGVGFFLEEGQVAQREAVQA